MVLTIRLSGMLALCGFGNPQSLVHLEVFSLGIISSCCFLADLVGFNFRLCVFFYKSGSISKDCFILKSPSVGLLFSQRLFFFSSQFSFSIVSAVLVETFLSDASTPHIMFYARILSGASTDLNIFDNTLLDAQSIENFEKLQKTSKQQYSIKTKRFF